MCMNAWVYEYLTHVCAYMCNCTHAYMYFWQYPPSIEVGCAGFAPPYIGKLPTPMLLPFGFQNVNGVSGPQPLISKQ